MDEWQEQEDITERMRAAVLPADSDMGVWAAATILSIQAFVSDMVEHGLVERTDASSESVALAHRIGRVFMDYTAIRGAGDTDTGDLLRRGIPEDIPRRPRSRLKPEGRHPRGK